MFRPQPRRRISSLPTYSAIANLPPRKRSTSAAVPRKSSIFSGAHRGYRVSWAASNGFMADDGTHGVEPSQDNEGKSKDREAKEARREARRARRMASMPETRISPVLQAHLAIPRSTPPRAMIANMTPSMAESWAQCPCHLQLPPARP